MILHSILPMLRNDICRVCEATCRVHGRPGAAPNFAGALVCLVACEVLGRLSSTEVHDENAALEFIRSVADSTGDSRYREAAKPLFFFFRHGLVHSFLPKQATTMKGKVAWATEDEGVTGVCLAELRAPSGASELDRLRADHLKVTGKRDPVFVLIPQVLAADVLTSIDAFDERLRTSDPQTMERLEAGFEKWWGRTSNIKRRLDEPGRRYLGL
jgi:hypothetical protein